MSNQKSSSSFTSSISFSASSSSSVNGQQTSGSRYAQQSVSDESGTHVRSASQKFGEPVVQEERRYDTQGREMLTGAGGADENRRIEDVSEEQKERDKEYEERIEEEYAKREGGA